MLSLIKRAKKLEEECNREAERPRKRRKFFADADRSSSSASGSVPPKEIVDVNEGTVEEVASSSDVEETDVQRERELHPSEAVFSSLMLQ